MAPSYYLNQCWPTTDGVLCHSIKLNVTSSFQDINPLGGFENYTSIITAVFYRVSVLTHWGRVMQICVGKLTNIGSYKGLLPGQRQAII